MNIVRTLAVTSLFAVAQLTAAPLPYPAPKPAEKARPVVKPNPVMPARQAVKPNPVMPARPVVKPIPAAKAQHPAAKAHHKAPAHGQKKPVHHDKKHGKDAVQAKDRHWHESSSSSSSSSFFASRSSDSHAAYDGAYTPNLSLNVDFDPSTLTNVLTPIAGSNPAAFAMMFTTNEPGSPKHIGHPVGTDTTSFYIEKSGVYLINWSFTVGCLIVGEEDGCVDGFFVQLYDVANNVALNPNPFQFVDTETFEGLLDSEVISGQQLIQLNSGVQLQLRVIPAVVSIGPLWIANPSFTVTRIDR